MSIKINLLKIMYDVFSSEYVKSRHRDRVYMTDIRLKCYCCNRLSRKTVSSLICTDNLLVCFCRT